MCKGLERSRDQCFMILARHAKTFSGFLEQRNLDGRIWKSNKGNFTSTGGQSVSYPLIYPERHSPGFSQLPTHYPELHSPGLD